MLTKPQHGWTDFSLGESSYSLSYLSNIPMDWLDRAIFGLQTLMPFEVYGYCEPGRIIFLKTTQIIRTLEWHT